ncbi:hypothetical protein [Burkholderia cenocepacia]|uniref:hypothetical protein n=1 Tax=Burkholderia cenocepacia TaxID=95486 RepID=UPI0012B21B3C|nr:hypothetical protein [Burkholderia cenocepacia]
MNTLTYTTLTAHVEAKIHCYHQGVLRSRDRFEYGCALASMRALLALWQLLVRELGPSAVSRQVFHDDNIRLSSLIDVASAGAF